MAAAAGLAVTLIPVLMGYLIRGKIPAKTQPAQPAADRAYRPLLERVLRHFRRATLLVAALIAARDVWPVAPGRRIHAAAGRRGPAVHAVGAAGHRRRQGGRAAAADRPPDQDRAGGADGVRQGGQGRVGHRSGAARDVRDHHPVQAARAVARRDDAGQAGRGTRPRRQGAGLSNVWVPPIRNRIDMLATGIKSPVGVKVAGTSLQEIDRITGAIERVAQTGAGRLVGAGRAAQRRALHRRPDRPRRRGALWPEHRRRAGRRLRAIGGDNIGETVEGLQRFPINVRYPREVRDSLEKLRELPVLTEAAPRSGSATWRRSASTMARPCSRARTRACRAGCMSTSAGAT
jgi:Cu(I)/Ag(I) efflux system membrane protein CusA/SilA